jgi:hypothetical protein
MKLFQFIFIIQLLTYGNSFSQEKNYVKLFKTSKEATVTISNSIDLDKYKDIIVIPPGIMFTKYFAKIGYFNEAINYKNLVKKYNAEKNGELKSTIYGEYYKNEKESLTLYLNMYLDDTVELSIGKFGYGAIFTVRSKYSTNLVGIHAGTKTIPKSTINAMMNELVNYIRDNSKTYKL